VNHSSLLDFGLLLKSRNHLRLAFLSLFWVTAVVAALLFARAYQLESYNVGWGDSAVDHGHAVLWWETATLVVGSFLLAILIGFVSRVALFSIVAGGALSWLLSFSLSLGSRGPDVYQIILLAPQFPGFVAAIAAVGVHGDERLLTWWIVCINTIIYAPIFHTVLARLAHRLDSRLKTGG
jgi:hypothetical protein